MRFSRQLLACSAASELYGVHFETASERRWRLRPPVEARARSKAQRVVGSLVDGLVAGEHEAAHGWKLSKSVSPTLVTLGCLVTCDRPFLSIS
jgi:hypothetical protein